MGFSCCVPFCKNTSSNSKLKFYRFPTAKHKLNQTVKWISNIRTMTVDGYMWNHLPHDRICSGHFVGNVKNDAELSPSYAPTIFPLAHEVTKINKKSAIKRHKRFMQRRLRMSEFHQCEYSVIEKVQIVMEDQAENDDALQIENTDSPKYHDVECQIDDSQFLKKVSHCIGPGKIFVCNRLVTVTIDKVTMESTTTNDAEIQTDIVLAKAIVIPSQKQVQNKAVNTEPKVYVNSGCG